MKRVDKANAPLLFIKSHSTRVRRHSLELAGRDFKRDERALPYIVVSEFLVCTATEGCGDK